MIIPPDLKDELRGPSICKHTNTHFNEVSCRTVVFPKLPRGLIPASRDPISDLIAAFATPSRSR